MSFLNTLQCACVCVSVLALKWDPKEQEVHPSADQEYISKVQIIFVISYANTQRALVK
jgi:hypothetical protein